MKNMYRKTLTYNLRLSGDHLAIFKAFCPIAEEAWVPDWSCNMLYSETGIAEKNCLFTTAHSGMPDMIWVCTEYDLGNAVEYLRVVPEHFVTSIRILTQREEDITACQVTYTHTALTNAGARHIAEHFTEDSFLAQIKSWEALIPAYLNSAL